MPGVINAMDIWDYLLIERKRWVKELEALISEEVKEAYQEGRVDEQKLNLKLEQRYLKEDNL
jgi:hypothetical protein